MFLIQFKDSSAIKKEVSPRTTSVFLHITNWSQSNRKAHSELQSLPYVPSTPIHTLLTQGVSSSGVYQNDLENFKRHTMAVCLHHAHLSGVRGCPCHSLVFEKYQHYRVCRNCFKGTHCTHTSYRAWHLKLQLSLSEIRNLKASLQRIPTGQGQMELQVFIAKTCARLAMHFTVLKGGSFFFYLPTNKLPNSGTFLLSVSKWKEGSRASSGVLASPTHQKEKNCHTSMCIRECVRTTCVCVQQAQG